MGQKFFWISFSTSEDTLQLVYHLNLSHQGNRITSLMQFIIIPEEQIWELCVEERNLWALMFYSYLNYHVILFLHIKYLKIHQSSIANKL